MLLVRYSAVTVLAIVASGFVTAENPIVRNVRQAADQQPAAEGKSRSVESKELRSSAEQQERHGPSGSIFRLGKREAGFGAAPAVVLVQQQDTAEQGKKDENGVVGQRDQVFVQHDQVVQQQQQQQHPHAQSGDQDAQVDHQRQALSGSIFRLGKRQAGFGGFGGANNNANLFDKLKGLRDKFTGGGRKNNNDDSGDDDDDDDYGGNYRNDDNDDNNDDDYGGNNYNDNDRDEDNDNDNEGEGRNLSDELFFGRRNKQGSDGRGWKPKRNNRLDFNQHAGGFQDVPNTQQRAGDPVNKEVSQEHAKNREVNPKISSVVGKEGAGDLVHVDRETNSTDEEGNKDDKKKEDEPVLDEKFKLPSGTIYLAQPGKDQRPIPPLRLEHQKVRSNKKPVKLTKVINKKDSANPTEQVGHVPETLDHLQQVTQDDKHVSVGQPIGQGARLQAQPVDDQQHRWLDGPGRGHINRHHGSRINNNNNSKHNNVMDDLLRPVRALIHRLQLALDANGNQHEHERPRERQSWAHFQRDQAEHAHMTKENNNKDGHGVDEHEKHEHFARPVNGKLPAELEEKLRGTKDMNMDMNTKLDQAKDRAADAQDERQSSGWRRVTRKRRTKRVKDAAHRDAGQQGDHEQVQQGPRRPTGSGRPSAGNPDPIHWETFSSDAGQDFWSAWKTKNNKPDKPFVRRAVHTSRLRTEPRTDKPDENVKEEKEPKNDEKSTKPDPLVDEQQHQQGQDESDSAPKPGEGSNQENNTGGDKAEERDADANRSPDEPQQPTDGQEMTSAERRKKWVREHFEKLKEEQHRFKELNKQLVKVVRAEAAKPKAVEKTEENTNNSTSAVFEVDGNTEGEEMDKDNKEAAKNKSKKTDKKLGTDGDGGEETETTNKGGKADKRIKGKGKKNKNGRPEKPDSLNEVQRFLEQLLGFGDSRQKSFGGQRPGFQFSFFI